MCFNISIAKTAQQIASFYGINSSEIPPLPEYYNVSGFSFPELPVLSMSGGGQNREMRIELMRWGLIPSWVRTVRDAGSISLKTLNARSETLSRLPSFRDSVKTQRCVLVTDGFFEPHHAGKSVIPFYIRQKDRGIISLAGLYAVWKNPESLQDVRTFSVITTEANVMLSEIHNAKKRMPVLLPESREDISRWLDPETPQKKVLEYLQSRDYPDMEAFPVSKAVYRKSGSNTLLSQHPARYPELEGRFFP